MTPCTTLSQEKVLTLEVILFLFSGNRGALRSTNTSNMMGHSGIYDTSVLMESMYMDRSRLEIKKPQLSSNFRIIRT